MAKGKSGAIKPYKATSKAQQGTTVREIQELYPAKMAGAIKSTAKAVTVLGKLTPATTIEKMHMVKSGVSKTYLERVKTKTRLDYQKLANVLAVTKATLIKKKKAQKFNIPLSERIVGLADLYDFGFEVFEDEEKFNSWMVTPNAALGGQTPYDLIDNQYGREEVRNILGRIEYGVYS